MLFFWTTYAILGVLFASVLNRALNAKSKQSILQGYFINIILWPAVVLFYAPKYIKQDIATILRKEK